VRALVLIAVFVSGCVFDSSGLDPSSVDRGLEGDLDHPSVDGVGDSFSGVEGQAAADAGADSKPRDVTVTPGDFPAPDSPIPVQDVGTDSVSYAWHTGAWGSCTKSCGGGTQSRSVWCQKNDGKTVPDSNCVGAKPATTQPCNTQPCCTQAPCCATKPCCTDPLQNKMRCDGKEKVQWTHWGGDKGDAADQASCQQKCTSWAKGQGYTTWCCRLYEDSSPGTNWVCRVYKSSSMSPTGSAINYSSLGHCH
jgi:hypothetical protein